MTSPTAFRRFSILDLKVSVKSAVYDDDAELKRDFFLFFWARGSVMVCCGCSGNISTVVFENIFNNSVTHLIVMVYLRNI